MSPGPGWIAAAILLLLILFALMSAARAALPDVSRARLSDPHKRSLAALALGQMLLAALAGAATLLLVRDVLPLEALVVSLGIAVLFAFLALVLPTRYGAAHAEQAGALLAGPVKVVTLLLGPPAAALETLAHWILKLAGLNGTPDTHSVHDELRETIDQHIKGGTVVKNDRDMLSGILAMQDLEVADIMVHRTKMTMIDLEEDSKEIVAKVLKSGHTRIPVWKETPDNIIGVLHAKNLFAALQKHAGDASRIDIEDILLPPWFVPDTRAIPDQLNAFLKRKSHFAIVVDEYGEVQGLVTLEDIIEEIVGDIKDEHDAVASGVRPKPDGSYLVDGAVPIRDINRAFDWTLPDEEANTIAGLVIHEARMIPEVGQAFVFHGFRFEILKKRRHQITALRMTPMKREGEAAEAPPP